MTEGKVHHHPRGLQDDPGMSATQERKSLYWRGKLQILVPQTLQDRDHLKQPAHLLQERIHVP